MHTYLLCVMLLFVGNKSEQRKHTNEPWGGFFSCIPAKAVNLLRSFPFSLCFLGSSEPRFSTHFSGCSGSHGMDSDRPWLCFPEVFLFLSVWTTSHPCFLFLFFKNRSFQLNNKRSRQFCGTEQIFVVRCFVTTLSPTRGK